MFPSFAAREANVADSNCASWTDKTVSLIKSKAFLLSGSSILLPKHYFPVKLPRKTLKEDMFLQQCFLHVVSLALIDILGPIVQRMDNAIHQINHYPTDSIVCFVNNYPLDSDLSSG